MASGKFLHFKNQPCNRLYPIKPAEMHWLGYNDAVSWLNKAKTRIFQPTVNFKINLYFVCQPAVRPGWAGVGFQKFHMIKVMGRFTKMLFRRQFTHCAMTIYKNVVLKMIYPRHDDSFYPSFPFLVLLYIRIFL